MRHAVFLGIVCWGRYLIQGHLNAEGYHAFLQIQLEYLLDDVPLATMRFQQDGVPAQ